jgi:hypothetical protein
LNATIKPIDAPRRSGEVVEMLNRGNEYVGTSHRAIVRAHSKTMVGLVVAFGFIVACGHGGGSCTPNEQTQLSKEACEDLCCSITIGDQTVDAAGLGEHDAPVQGCGFHAVYRHDGKHWTRLTQDAGPGVPNLPLRDAGPNGKCCP